MCNRLDKNNISLNICISIYMLNACPDIYFIQLELAKNHVLMNEIAAKKTLLNSHMQMSQKRRRKIEIGREWEREMDVFNWKRLI